MIIEWSKNKGLTPQESNLFSIVNIGTGPTIPLSHSNIVLKKYIDIITNGCCLWCLSLVGSGPGF